MDTFVPWWPRIARAVPEVRPGPSTTPCQGGLAR
jgi:hypothetical protein